MHGSCRNIATWAWSVSHENSLSYKSMLSASGFLFCFYLHDFFSERFGDFFKQVLLSIFISTVYVFCDSTSDLAKDSTVFPVTPGSCLTAMTSLGANTLLVYAAVIALV